MPITQYPRKGKTISPSLLRSVLEVPLPLSLRTLVGDHFATLADLDGSVWDYYTESVCARLAQAIIEHVRRSSHAPELAQLRLPNFQRNARLDDLHLLASTQGIIRSVAQEGELFHLSYMPLGQLLRLPLFSVTNLVDLLGSVEDAFGPAPEVGSFRALPQKEGESEVFLPVSSRDITDTVVTPEDLGGLLESVLPVRVLSMRLPYVSGISRPAELVTTVRVRNCLQRLVDQRVIDELGDLGDLTVQQLLETRNFGRKSLLHLVEALQPYISDGGGEEVELEPRKLEPSTRVTAALEDLRDLSYAGLIRCDDPRLKRVLGPLLVLANNTRHGRPLNTSATLSDVAHRAIGRSTDPSDEETALRTIRAVSEEIERLVAESLEEELHEVVARAVATERRIDMVVRYYGLAGSLPQTLQEVGDLFGVTRERVRQVCAPFERIPATIFLPALDKGIACVADCAPTSIADAESRLRDTGVTQCRFAVESVVSAAKAFSRPIPFAIENGTVVPVDRSGVTAKVLSFVRRTVSHYGVANVADMVERTTDALGSKIRPEFITTIVESEPGRRWLDPERKWFFVSTARNHLLTVIGKVFSVAPRVTLSDLRTSLRRDRRFGFAPPKRVLGALCESLALAKMEDGFLLPIRTHEPQSVLSEMELIFVDVFRQYGPVLHRANFERKSVARGMHPGTFHNYLCFSPILTPYGAGVYSLVGATVSPGEVEACIPARRPPAIRDYGWTTDGLPWLALRLTPATISSGVFSVPSSMSPFVQGRFVLKDSEGVRRGTLAVDDSRGWGLAPMFRRSDAEPSDELLLIFNLQTREGYLDLGENLHASMDSGEGISAARLFPSIFPKNRD